MEQWLKVKTAGLPRWAWLAILGGAVGVGIYLRIRSQEEEFGPEEEGVEEPEEGLSQYEGTEQAGGLAAAGLVGPAQGQITPVEAPVIPEGITDIIGAQNETLTNALGALSAQEPGERVETERTTEVEGEGQAERENIRKEEREEREKLRHHHALTGGGSPKRKPHHKPPRKPKQKKAAPKHHKQPKKNRSGRRPRRAGLSGGVAA